MNDNKKFKIKEYRDALYLDIMKRKKEIRSKKCGDITPEGIITIAKTNNYEDTANPIY